MIIGLPKEIKDSENRVGLTPGAVRALVRRGHRVLVEAGAGAGSTLGDEEYRAAGGEIVESASEAWGAQMVVKVKEPVEAEYHFLRSNLLLYTYLHLAADRPLTNALLESGTTAIAYETVQLANGHLPLLMPMSEVAGRMAAQVGAYYLETPNGGRGVLMGGVPGVAPADVVVLGGGIVGTNAAKVALGMGAQVTVLDISHERLQYLDDIFLGRLQTRMSNEGYIEEMVLNADLVIGAVLIPGGRAPWARHARHAERHAPQRRHHRRRRGPGRLRRDQPSHHPQRSHLCRRRRAALLRRQHAGGRAAHEHLRADQSDAALCD